MAVIIDYELNDAITQPLELGQLAYSYETNKLLIGSLNSGNLELLDSDSRIENYIIQNITQDILDKSPSSDAVYREFLNRAHLVYSNTFLAANYFPDVDIYNCPDTQEQLVVNVKSVKKYVEDKVNYQFTQSVPIIVKRFLFLSPSDQWVIDNLYNTDRVTIEVYELGSNNRIICPYEITVTEITILFATPVSGYVDVTFIKEGLDADYG